MWDSEGSWETCVHCQKPLIRETFNGQTVLVDIPTGGDICGTWGTFENEPHVSDREN